MHFIVSSLSKNKIEVSKLKFPSFQTFISRREQNRPTKANKKPKFHKASTVKLLFIKVLPGDNPFKGMNYHFQSPSVVRAPKQSPARAQNRRESLHSFAKIFPGPPLTVALTVKYLE